MALMDFASRLLGYNPFDTQNSNAPVSGQQASTAAIAQPTLGQMYQDDLRQAQFDKLGNLGMLLLASSQQLTPAQRATILTQAPQYMDGAQRDAMTAAQARLMNMQGKATQDEMTRADTLRQRFNDPNFVKSLGLSQDQAQVLGPAGIQKLLENQAMANTPENILDRQYKQAQIEHLLNPPKTQATPQMVDLPGGGKGWATPGSADVMPIGGAGKGGLDPDTVKRSDNEDMNLTYAKEAITANRVLSDPSISGDLTSGYKNRINKIPTLEGSWAGKQYLTGDSQANSFIDSVVRPRSGAVIGKDEEAGKKRIFTPMPGDTQEQLFDKAKMRSQHIQSLIAGANPADRPMLQKMFQDSEQELLGMIPGAQNSQPQLPPGVSIRRVN
jgi:hypothetical protein